MARAKTGGKGARMNVIFSIEFFANSTYWQAYANSVFLLAACLVGQFVVSVLGGWGLARYEFWGRKALLVCCVVLALFPPQVMLYPQYLLLNGLGLLHSLWGLVFLSVACPLGSVLLWHGFSNLSDEMLEAAQLDGAGVWHGMVRFALPLCKRELAVFVFIASAETWNLLEQPMAYLANSTQYPLSVYLSAAAYQSQTQLILDAALALVPMLVIFLLVQIVRRAPP